MDSEELSANKPPLTVNEQVIVMSGHETIRVLEVEVDSSLTSSDRKALAEVEEGGKLTSEGRAQSSPTEANKTKTGALGEAVVSAEVSTPAAQILSGHEAVSVSVHQPQTTLPITVQACPQVLTQEGLATLMTSMMAPHGSLGQPLLIPFSMGNSVTGQGGMALLTFPTATVATLPGLAAASSAGGLLKLPFAGLQAATMLNSVQPQLQMPAQTLFAPQTLQSMQAAVQTCTQSTPTTAAQIATATTAATPKVSEPSACVATLQTAGLSLNPAIFSAASLGAQPQFISSLTTTPIFTSAMPNMAGLTSHQIITNAQGQVIGTLPLMLNPASLAGGATTQALSTQGLQLQTMAPQLLLNAQGQIIATIGNGPAQVPTSSAVLPKAATALTLTKPASQGPVVTVAQSPVVIAPQPSVVKPAPPSLASAVPLACGEAPTVGQLVSKPQQGGTDEECINLEEIREFAKTFKIRRLSLGLTQTQVGQALTATEGPAYSQSAICRFEKLDITPKSAQKLKPVLERWLAEAELWNQKGQQNLMEFVGGEPSKKRKRRTSFTPQAIEVLNSYFEKNALPTGQEITQIAKELNYDREVVRVWFCNRRQTLKNTSKINVFQVQQQQQQLQQQQQQKH
ncbi:POU domain, class 6, transcription factor 1 isoform X2 [Clupea harengus]|uniref:POU domain protein n=1 Tax=Clupea harengus TaxID=7950 RepID=A0A8M1KAT7_CLUHA|nr:POU domain, class 6, transcription factor 1 isoform X2 [Clupea harengus]